MAFLMKRGRFWWITYRETPDGPLIRESTKLLVDDEVQTASAELIAAKWTLKEKGDAAAKIRGGFDWVEEFLADHCQSPRTLQAYRLHWKHLRHFFTVEGIHCSADVRFAHGAQYVKWRMRPKAHNGKSVGRNTALQELKTLSLVMRHAALRGEIQVNPIQHLGIAREETEERQEFLPSEIERCKKLLESERRKDPRNDWMYISFMISLHTGLRLTETRLAMRHVDFERKRITIPRPKGGKTRAFTRPLPDILIPILKPLTGREYSHDFPFQPSRCFQNFFKRAGVPHLVFHGLRVTYITRLAREGVPLAAAMALVNHSSKAVHRIYQRIGCEDVQKYANV